MSARDTARNLIDGGAGVTQESFQKIATALYLRAVLPAFEDLTRVSEQARALLAGWRCSVEFAVCGAGGATLSFRDGAVAVSPERSSNSSLSLFFLSPLQLIKQFSGKGFSLPLPRRGIFRPGSLLRFQKIGALFQKEVEQHPRLLLSVALGSLPPLAELDHAAQHLLGNCPHGTAQISVPSSDLFGWTKWDGHAVTWGRGHPPHDPDVIISFANETVALAALRGELDEWSAIGAGELSVRGLVPLAETLGLVMARASVYLEPDK